MTAATVEIDGTKFDSLAKTYWQDLYHYAYRLSGNRSTAEDLVQDSLIRAWRSRGQLRNQSAIKGWLKTIVRRENARRFERTQPRQSDLPLESLGTERNPYDTSTEAFVLRRAVAALPKEYSEPLILQVLHGHSQQEIANRLGLSSAGVGTRLFRARRKLRHALGELA